MDLSVNIPHNDYLPLTLMLSAGLVSSYLFISPHDSHYSSACITCVLCSGRSLRPTSVPKLTYVVLLYTSVDICEFSLRYTPKFILYIIIVARDLPFLYFSF